MSYDTRAGSSLHIGYLIQQFPPEVGAGAARAAEFALRWQAAGARVTIITGMPNRPQGRIHPEYRGKVFVEDSWKGIRVLRSWLYASKKPGFARTISNNASFMVTCTLHALVRAGRPDVLIASSPPFFPHIAGSILSWVMQVPLILELRDLWPDYLVGMGIVSEGVATRALFSLERQLLQKAARVVVVTPSFKIRVEKKGVDPDKVDVISNGVDTDLYFPCEEPPPISSLERQANTFLVGYLGNFGAGQHLAQVIDAAALAQEKDPRLRFVLAGDGPQRDVVAARVLDLGLRNTSIHPPIPKEQTRAFYNACHVCLVPLAPFSILQETVPSKIFEIMACARPVIGAMDGEGAGLIARSGSGICVRPGDPEALCDAICELAEMPERERSALGERGRDFVRVNYSRDSLAAAYLTILEVVKDKNPVRKRGRDE